MYAWLSRAKRGVEEWVCIMEHVSNLFIADQNRLTEVTKAKGVYDHGLYIPELPTDDVCLAQGLLHDQNQFVHDIQESQIRTNRDAELAILLVTDQVHPQTHLRRPMQPIGIRPLDQRRGKHLGQRIAGFECLLDDAQDGHRVADLAMVEQAKGVRESCLEVQWERSGEEQKTTQALVQGLTQRLDLFECLAVEWGAGEFEVQEANGPVEGCQDFGHFERYLLGELAGLAVFWMGPACEE